MSLRNLFGSYSSRIKPPGPWPDPPVRQVRRNETFEVLPEDNDKSVFLKYVDNIAIVIPLSLENTEELSNELKAVLEGDCKHILFNLSECDRINSAFIVLLSHDVLKPIVKRGGCVALCSVKPEIKDLFEMTNLDQLFQIYETVDEAINALK